MDGEELMAVQEARYIVAKLNRACAGLPVVVRWAIDEHSVESNGTCGRFWIYGTFTSGHAKHPVWRASRWGRVSADEPCWKLPKNAMRLIGGAIRQVFRELLGADRTIVVTRHTVTAPRVFKDTRQEAGERHRLYWGDLYAITFYLCEESQIIHVPIQCSDTK